jgi:TPR repeat protein
MKGIKIITPLIIGFVALSIPTVYADVSQDCAAFIKQCQWQQALSSCTTAASNGDSQAQLSLGTMYSKAQGVPQDHQEAYRWYKLAADQGLAEAKSSLPDAALSITQAGFFGPAPIIKNGEPCATEQSENESEGTDIEEMMEEIDGPLSKDPFPQMTKCDIIRAKGYPCEED